MIRYVCAVRDRAADSFGQPFFAPSVGVAVRSFTDEVNRNAPDNGLWAHPDDYDLYLVGTFDDSLGALRGAMDLEGGVIKQICIGKQVAIR